MDNALPDWVIAGASFKYDYGPANHNTGRKFHVRGIVDGFAVLREWWPSKQRWNYTVEDPYYFHARKNEILIVRRAPANLDKFVKNI